MMRKLFVILCLLTASIFGSAQPFVIEWQQCLGELYDDFVYDAYFTGDGYLLACQWKGRDVKLIKTDLDGMQMWEKKLGGSGVEAALRIVPMEDGNAILVCGSSSSDGDIGFDPYPESTNFWIVKVTPTGDILWENIYGGSCIEHTRNGIPTSDGGIIALGWTCSDDGDISNYIGAWDTWMVKLDTDGNKIWDFTMGTVDFDFASAIIETSDHGLLIASASTPTVSGNIDCVPQSEYSEIVLFKLDSVANIEWQQCFGGSYHDNVADIIELSDGFLLACKVESGDGDVAGAGYHVGFDGMYNQYPTSDIWMVKIDFSGNIRWSKCYGGSGREYARRIFKTPDGGFMVFGETSSYDGDVEGNHSGGPGAGFDIWVFKINEIGELVWQQCFGKHGSQILESGVIDHGDGSFVIASTIRGTNSGQVTCQTNFYDEEIWLIKIQDTTFVGTNNHNLPELGLSVYPNPAGEYVVFELTDATINAYPHRQTIFITDIYGRPVAEVMVTSEKTVWDTRSVAPGVYLYKMNDAKHVASGKIILSNH